MITEEKFKNFMFENFHFSATVSPGNGKFWAAFSAFVASFDLKLF